MLKRGVPRAGRCYCAGDTLTPGKGCEVPASAGTTRQGAARLRAKARASAGTTRSPSPFPSPIKGEGRQRESHAPGDRRTRLRRRGALGCGARAAVPGRVPGPHQHDQDHAARRLHVPRTDGGGLGRLRFRHHRGEPHQRAHVPGQGLRQHRRLLVQGVRRRRGDGRGVRILLDGRHPALGTGPGAGAPRPGHGQDRR